MAKKTKMQTKNPENMLTAKERTFCLKVVVLEKQLATQRAAALLALDEGATIADAAARSGLTLGQVRYLAARFRQIRLAMFSDELVGAKKEEEAREETKKTGKKKKKKAAKAEKKSKSKKPDKSKSKQKKKAKGKKKTKGKKKKKK